MSIDKGKEVGKGGAHSGVRPAKPAKQVFRIPPIAPAPSVAAAPIKKFEGRVVDPLAKVTKVAEHKANEAMQNRLKRIMAGEAGWLRVEGRCSSGLNEQPSEKGHVVLVVEGDQIVEYPVSLRARDAAREITDALKKSTKLEYDGLIAKHPEILKIQVLAAEKVADRKKAIQQGMDFRKRQSKKASERQEEADRLHEMDAKTLDFLRKSREDPGADENGVVVYRFTADHATAIDQRHHGYITELLKQFRDMRDPLNPTSKRITGFTVLYYDPEAEELAVQARCYSEEKSFEAIRKRNRDPEMDSLLFVHPIPERVEGKVPPLKSLLDALRPLMK